MPIPERTKKKSKLGKFKISGGQFSAKELKKQFERSGDGTVIYLKPDEDIRVRFLVEPDEFYSYTEHSLNMNGKWTTVPCIGEGCPACDSEEGRTTQRVLIPVWDVEKKKVRLYKAGAKLAQDILKFHAKGRLLGRDFTIMREGEGIDTRYLLDPEEKSKRPEAKGAEIPDIEKILKGWVERAYAGGKPKKKDEDEDFEDSDEEEDDEEEETKKKKKKKSKSKDEDEDEDEEEDEDEDEDEKPKKKKGKKKSESEDEDEDEDEDEEEESEEEDEEEKPKKPKKLKKKSKKDDDEEDDDEEEDEDED